MRTGYSLRGIITALCVAGALVFLSSCAQDAATDLSRVAAIHDLVHPFRTGKLSTAEFELMSVDGAPVERLKEFLVDVPPYALLKPGVHVLRVKQLVPGETVGSEFTFSCAVEAGKGYGIKISDGIVSLFEEANQ